MLFGNPFDEKPGKNIIFPIDGSYVKYKEIELNTLRKSYMKHINVDELTNKDKEFLIEELNITNEQLTKIL